MEEILALLAPSLSSPQLPPPPLSPAQSTFLATEAAPALPPDTVLATPLDHDQIPKLKQGITTSILFDASLLSLLLLISAHERTLPTPPPTSTSINIASLLLVLPYPPQHAIAFTTHHLLVTDPLDKAAYHLFQSFNHTDPTHSLPALQKLYETLPPTTPSLPTIKHLLSTLGHGPNTTSGDPDYIAARFDDLSDVFEDRLTGVLGYDVPAILVAMVPMQGAIVDLGCGTGLLAKALPPSTAATRTLHGCDLSLKMCSLANATGLYHDAKQCDVTAYLATFAVGSVDVVVSADTYIYVGDLAEHATAVERCLTRTGLWAFSVEDVDEGGEEMKLLLSGRYAHSERYIERVVEGVNMGVDEVRKIVVRKELGEDITGRIYIVKKK